MRITENLYVYPWQNLRENNCNSVVITGKVPVLIDPGHREYVPELFRRMTEDGLNPKHIKAVICTHGHLDHGEGLAAFDSQTVYRAISLRERQYIEEMKRAKTPPPPSYS